MISQGKDKHLVVALLDTLVILFFKFSFPNVNILPRVFYHILDFCAFVCVYKVSMNCLRASFT